MEGNFFFLSKFIVFFKRVEHSCMQTNSSLKFNNISFVLVYFFPSVASRKFNDN